MTGRCYLCRQYGVVEHHHIFGGSNRKKSERYGLVVMLCPVCHREGKNSAHKSGDTARRLHELGQHMWMTATGGDIDDFRREFGKNYI